jgi:hypothetical protein
MGFKRQFLSGLLLTVICSLIVSCETQENNDLVFVSDVESDQHDDQQANGRHFKLTKDLSKPRNNFLNQ